LPPQALRAFVERLARLALRATPGDADRYSVGPDGVGARPRGGLIRHDIIEGRRARRDVMAFALDDPAQLARLAAGRVARVCGSDDGTIADAATLMSGPLRAPRRRHEATTTRSAGTTTSEDRGGPCSTTII